MVEINTQKIDEVLSRGVEDVIVREDLKKLMVSGKRIRLYFGVDPTGSTLHLGHAVALWKLRDFQDLGHEVILLIGDFTARIGDPTGRDAARKPLGEKEIKENFKNYKKEASKILDFSKVKIKYNSKWLGKLNFADIIKLSSNFTMQQMVQRDMFQKRISENLPINLQEFMYPLMQGYDSVAMDVDLEIGGNDQMFNMLAGRTLQKIYNNKEKNVMTLKLLLGTDGRKMSKTFQNYIPITADPADMFGKIMSIKDDLIGQYFEIATRMPPDKIADIEKSWDNPRDRKAILAKEIVRMYHGEKAAQKAGEEFDKVHKNKELPSEMPLFEAGKKEYFVLDLLCDIKLAASKNEAKRLVEQGALSINGAVEKDWRKAVQVEDGMVIKVGSRKFVKIKIR